MDFISVSLIVWPKDFLKNNVNGNSSRLIFNKYFKMHGFTSHLYNRSTRELPEATPQRPCLSQWNRRWPDVSWQNHPDLFLESRFHQVLLHQQNTADEWL